MVSASANSGYEDVFIANYRREYGFELIGRDVLVDDIRVRAVGASASSVALRDIAPQNTPTNISQTSAAESEIVQVYFEGGQVATPVYHLASLPPSTILYGPAIIMQNVATVVLDPDCRAVITAAGMFTPFGKIIVENLIYIYNIRVPYYIHHILCYLYIYFILCVFLTYRRY